MMEIKAINRKDNLSASQITKTQTIDISSKKIEKDLKEVQREKQELTSDRELSPIEEAKKRRELQQEKAKLDAELRQRKEELKREQQKEALKEEMRAENSKNKKEDEGVSVGKSSEEDKRSGKKEVENIDSEKGKSDNFSRDEIDAIITADSAMKETRSQNAIIAKMKDAIVIQKGEIRQDEMRGADVEKKKAKVASEERKINRAIESEFSSLGKASRRMEEKLKVNPDGTMGNNGNGTTKEKPDQAFHVAITP